MVIHQEELQKLFDTGWQSWSFSHPDTKGITFPPCLFPPEKVTIPSVVTVSIKKKKPVKGWCSFYAFGTYITEEKITKEALRAHAEHFAEISKKLTASEQALLNAVKAMVDIYLKMYSIRKWLISLR
jgi:hypothetical protein